jgi:hypothetical protein
MNICYRNRPYLSHLFAIVLWVQWCFGQQHWMFFGCDTQLVIERMMPDLFHIIPVGDNTVFDRILECENATFRLRFIADIRIFLTHTDHHTLII